MLSPDIRYGRNNIYSTDDLSGHDVIEQGAKNAGSDVDQTVAAFDKYIQGLTGFQLKELTPVQLAKNVTVPTLFAQVKEDSLIDTTDSQEIFDQLSSKEKELLWIEGTTRKFDGYNYFAKNPERMVEWFTKYI